MDNRADLRKKIIASMDGKIYRDGKYTCVPFEDDVIEIEKLFETDKEVIEYIIDNKIFEEMLEIQKEEKNSK